MPNHRNWKTDPILFDRQPTPPSRWLTANNLLELGQLTKIFLPVSDEQLLNLYSIMIRKWDFCHGERLLQSMPYILLDAPWVKKVRKNSLALAERCYYYFDGSITNFSIKQWQQKVIKYTEQQRRIPFPMFRLANEWETFFEGKRRIWFQSARGEAFQIPVILSAELAYLLGVIMGDGHLSKYAVYLVDYSKEQIQQLAKKMQKLFGSNGLLYSQGKKIFNLCQKGKWLVRFVHFLTGQIIDGKKYQQMQEPQILKREEALRKAFWQGMMDSDGSYRGFISLCSSVKSILKDFCAFITDYGVGYGFYENRSPHGVSYYVAIKAKSRKRFIKIIKGSQHPLKQKELTALLAKTKGKVGRPKRKQGGELHPEARRFKVENIRADRVVQKNGKEYFDFHLVTDLQVRELTDWLQKSLFQMTTKELARELIISRQRFRSYEKGTAIPLYLVKKLLQIAAPSKELMPFLERHKVNYYQSGKTKAKLPLSPSKVLEQIVEGLELQGQYLFSKRREQKQQVARLFDVPWKRKKLSNSVVKKFLETFMQLKEIKEIK